MEFLPDSRQLAKMLGKDASKLRTKITNMIKAKEIEPIPLSYYTAGGKSVGYYELPSVEAVMAVTMNVAPDIAMTFLKRNGVFRPSAPSRDPDPAPRAEPDEVIIPPVDPRAQRPVARVTMASPDEPLGDFEFITLADGSLGADSREIARYYGKRHDNVLVDSRAHLASVGEDALKFQGVYLGGNGEERPCFHLPMNYALGVMTVYDPVRRQKIIDQWIASLTQGRVVSSTPLTISDQRKLEMADSAFISLHTLTCSGDDLTLSKAAKMLGVPQRKWFKWVQEQHLVFKDKMTGEYVPYKNSLENGWIKIKREIIQGTGRVVNTCYITPEGLVAIELILQQNPIEKQG